MRNLIGTIVVGVALIGAGAWLLVMNSASLQDRIFDRVLEARLEKGNIPLNENSLYVFICGSGSPLPDADRASACTAIIAGGDIYLVDVGPGSAAVLQRSGLDLSRVKGVLLTHFHSDHIGDLGDIAMKSWTAGRQGALTVYGPVGVATVSDGFMAAYSFDENYRVAHHGADLLPEGGLELVSQVVEATPFELDILKVMPFPVDHAPIDPALGYRFDFLGRSVLVSGDTTPNETLKEIGQDVDVLVHEALSIDLMLRMSDKVADMGNDRTATLAADTTDYHTSPREAAKIANEVGAELLLLSHLVPPLPNPLMERIFLRGVDAIRPQGVRLAEDGLLLELPSGASEIIER